MMPVKPLPALLLSALAAGALAQANPALYEGTDRLERLIAGAKKEGELSLYTSAQADDIGAVLRGIESCTEKDLDLMLGDTALDIYPRLRARMREVRTVG